MKKGKNEKENEKKIKIKMNKTKKESIQNYCKLINKNIKNISEDEIKTACLFEKLIKKYNLQVVERINVPLNFSSNYFYNYYYKKNKPVIISNLNHKIGKCLKKFDNKNIIKNIGKTKVSIHVSNSKFLNNVNKNFRYVLSSLEDFIFLISEEDKKKKKFSVSYHKGKIYITLKNTSTIEGKNKKENKETNNSEDRCYKVKNENFTNNYHIENKIPLNTNRNEINNFFMNQIKENQNEHNNYYYYRSLGVNHFKDVSDIKKMDSFIKDNFFLPKEIYPSYENFEFFSSILRIGQTNIFIWLHYDIPDNFLIQIRGRKKILLIHPKFIKYFNIIDSSSVYNLFHILVKKNLNKKERIIKKILIKFALVADLFEGDILFIPSLWLHYVYNMPSHTYIKKKYNNLHQHLVINKKNLIYNSSKNCKEKKKKHNTNNFYLNSKFKNVKKNKSLRTWLHLKDRKTILNYFFFKNTKNLNKKIFFSKYKKNPLKLHSNDILNINKVDECNYKIPVDQIIDKDDLIKHYSHLENYEEYLSKMFNISINGNIWEDNKVNFSKLEEERKFEIKKNEENEENEGNVENINNMRKNKCEYLKNSGITENENSNKVKKKKKSTCKDFCLNTKLNISVNYFFRKKKEICLFNKKDLYGNQDINVANQIFKKIQKEIKPIVSMSSNYKNFYLQKIQGLLYSYLDEEYI
ncbi:JmjC domain containing protein, putative [Plasmodium gallinaceum]|uniref:JmjC domain containing protein, putative n=1 Tax=Plasmodium gallinaceum TaxID=5849 RepID=A0A1J1GMD7_PLAGA|nr:JmjC domain containing protein, putative [Plasmodium gallinaceum]CRG93608.1 JmjC domain containing protein, putative [Plasmodium gallinaceum]